MVTVAAICLLALGVGFGLPAVFGTLHFAQTGEVCTFRGFPTSPMVIARTILLLRA